MGDSKPFIGVGRLLVMNTPERVDFLELCWLISRMCVEVLYQLHFMSMTSNMATCCSFQRTLKPFQVTASTILVSPMINNLPIGSIVHNRSPWQQALMLQSPIHSTPSCSRRPFTETFQV